MAVRTGELRVEHSIESATHERQNVYLKAADGWYGYSSVYEVPKEVHYFRRGFLFPQFEPYEAIDQDGWDRERHEHYQQAVAALEAQARRESRGEAYGG